jgi:hypothetical protein
MLAVRYSTALLGDKNKEEKKANVLIQRITFRLF